MKLFLAIISWCLAAIDAQVYHFDDIPVAESKSLNMMYVYFLFDKDDARDTSLGPTYVSFHDLTLQSTSKDRDDASLKDYKGIQVSLLRYSTFWDQIDPGRMCATQQDVSQGLSKSLDHLIIKRDAGQTFEDAHVYRHQLSFQTKTPDQKIAITKSGVYVLIVSNCGNFDQAVMSGDVVVRNPHGYLPANEYDKMPFYAGLCGVYIFLAIVWALCCVRWWNELLSFHFCIGIVLILGACECLLWYLFLMDWNGHGIRGHTFFGSAVLASVTRTTLSYMLVLLASLGWGVTRPVLDNSLSCRIGLLSFSYILLNFVREIVISYRHSHSVPQAFVFLVLLPVSLMNGGIFYWVFSALSTLTETLEAQSQTQKLSVFKKLWWILIIAIGFAIIVLLVQVFIFSQNAGSTWREQWIITDCAPQVGFVFVLISIMFLWAPHADSQRLAYSTQIDGDEDGDLGTAAAPEAADGSIWTDKVGVDQENDDDSFWASTKKDPSNAPPDVIGAER